MNRNSHLLITHPLNRTLVATLLAVLLLPTGCAHRKGAGSGFSKRGQENSPTGPLFSEAGNWSEAGLDGAAESVPLSGRPDDISFDSPKVRKDLFEPVFFPFDRYEVDSSEAPKIQRIATYLRSHSAGVIVAGHTDSTGTTEYNRNLGERRALAIRAALLQQGIQASQVQTMSFGEDRPAQAGEAESAYSVNRRAEFGVFESVLR